MSLAERVLFGVQRWYEAAVQDLIRARLQVKLELGRQLRSAGCPESLTEARVLLRFIIQRGDLAEERGVRKPFLTSLARRASDLLVAVESAESREGVGVMELVDGLLKRERTVEHAVDECLGYSLNGLRPVCHSLPRLAGSRNELTLSRGGTHRQTVADSGK